MVDRARFGVATRSSFVFPHDNGFFLTIGDFKVRWRRSSGRGSILFSDSDESISTMDAVPAIESVESSSLGTGPRYLSWTLYSYRHHVFFLLLRQIESPAHPKAAHEEKGSTQEEYVTIGDYTAEYPPKQCSNRHHTTADQAKLSRVFPCISHRTAPFRYRWSKRLSIYLFLI